MGTSVALRLVLYEGETIRVDRRSQGVHIRHGAAWVSYAGQDAILHRGEELRLQPGRDFAVVSALGCRELVLEIMGPGQRRSTPRISPPLRRGVPLLGPL